MASFVASVKGQAVVTLDYGSGSPQEAAAFLAYFNGAVGNTTAIGQGPEWNDSTGSWQTVDWKTAGYWASLRAAAPLATDDGLNFLRVSHPASFGFHDYEVGNEEYGSWEIDHHSSQHDPATYVAFAKQFATLAASIDPTISIGIDAGSPYENNNWVANVLQQSASQGFMPGFISDHNYVGAPWSESDSNLLLNTVSNPNSPDPNNPYDWAVRASDYQQLLTQYLGAAGKNVELLGTEFNSVYSNPGKQTTSLVNGLFLADSLGELMTTPYDGADVWDLRNGWDTSNNDSSNLYGWRQGGDYGLLGSSGGSAPSTGTYVPYPTYFAEQLGSKIIQAGGSVVKATSSDANLTTYAVVEPNGDLALLVINKSASSALTGQFQVANFAPGTQANTWQYGIAQDTAQSQTSDGHSALANFTTAISASGGAFSLSFPAYSMTVLDIPKGTGTTAGGPTITQAAAATPNPVTGTSTALTVAATDPAGASTLTYTWTTTGTPPAPVAFSTNGTNAAQATTARFSKVGTYSFLVTATDPSGLIATSAVSVVVSQSVGSVTINPGSSTVAANGTIPFTASSLDQFGASITGPLNYAWTVVSGGGSIGAASGTYTAPASAGSATIQVAIGGVTATAKATITAGTTQGGPASIAFAETGDWGSGFGATITLTNTGTAPINGWTLLFNFPAAITSIWNASISNHSGNAYTLVNAGYDAVIGVGQSVSIGFNGSPGDLAAGPTGYVLNGVPITPTVPAIKASVQFADTNDWGSGFTGSITLTNTGTAPIMDWTLAFDFAGSITSIWNAAIVSHSGTHYVLQYASYNPLILPGQSMNFGFNATPGSPGSGPANYTLNGTRIG